MASAGTGGTLPPNFLLTPQQQSLLFAALNSNKQQLPTSSSLNGPLSLSPSSFQNSPVQTKNPANAFQESPYLDGITDSIDYDFGDSSFDFSFNDDQGKMIGDIPTAETTKSDTTDNDTTEKRSHPDDEGDEDSPGNDPKRRESTEKVPKKPGRKPLTSEPSSKRKAQNRAAQRAFRERKEKHLKDLETKVEELQKASDAANNENSLLRAKVEQMTSELQQYKQKVSLMTNAKSMPPREKPPPFGSAAVNNLGDISFQFEFPKFGMLPGPPASSKRSVSQPISPQSQSAQGASPGKQSNGTRSPQQILHESQFDDLAKLSGIFSPSMASSITNTSRVSLDSGNYSVGAATSSPSASSHSNTGPSSSCGTSPEPFTQSPMGFKPVDTMTTIGEEQPAISNSEQPFAQFANVDISSSNFDWLAQQNGGQFDPQLFGDYRESQDNVLSNPAFDDFFNDALDTDFLTPYNVALSPNLKQNSLHKKNLIEEIDAQKNADDEPLKKQNMNCNQLWEKLQACPNAQNGEFDLDGLCSELTKKAKCSGSGPVVAEQDFDTILQKYMGKDVSSNCVASKLGISINRDESQK